MERNLKMGVPLTQFYLFYGTIHMDIPGNTPTHLILIDFRSTSDALFPGTALNSSVTFLDLMVCYTNELLITLKLFNKNI